MTARAQGFGRVARSLHWLMAAGIFGGFALGAYVARMEVGLSNLWLFGLHKTVGICLLALALIRATWRRFDPPPGPLPGAARWEMALARATHRALRVLMLAVPLSGWAYASATGLDVVIFNSWTIPAIAPASERWETALHLLHRGLVWTLIGLVGLHVAGALKRSLIARDGTLSRMIFG